MVHATLEAATSWNHFEVSLLRLPVSLCNTSTCRSMCETPWVPECWGTCCIYSVEKDDYVEPEGNVPPRKGSPDERQGLVENEVLKDAAARERRRRVMLSPEVPAGEGFSRDNFIEIHFHKGETFARRIVRGSCMNKRGNASRYVKEDLPYDVPPMSTEFLSRD